MRQVAEKSSSRLVQCESPGNQQRSNESERTVHVVIVEAHLLIREALQRIIGGFPHVSVAAANRAQDILALLKRGEIDVLVLGGSLGACDCIEYIKIARQAWPSLGVVVIQRQMHPETALPIIKSGVQGLLGEDASPNDLAQAIAAAATGSTFLGQHAREILNDYVSHVPLHFTEREMQVLPLLRLGLSNFCIAQRLALKEKTVEKHLTHIYEKLHIHSRAEAMARIQTLHI